MSQNIFVFSAKLLVLAYLFLFNFGCSGNEKSLKSVKFIVKSEVPIGKQSIYLTGDNDMLGNWKPDAVPLQKQSDSIWTTTILINTGDKIQFKVTKGSWENEAVTKDGWLFKNFEADIKSDTSIRINIPNWKDFLYERTIHDSIFLNKEP